MPACSVKSEPVTIGLHVWPGYEPLPLARTLGWLDEKQVRLVETSSATDSLKQLEEGRIDGAGLTLDEVLRARENGIPLSVVLVCDISAGADMFLTSPEIKTLAGIKGRRVGVEDGALGALVLHEVLRMAKLGMDDIRSISLSSDQHADAWERGDIDAVVTFEPVATKILAMGANRLFDSRMIPDMILDVLAVRTTLLDRTHDDALHHMVATHLRALSYINTNPDDASYRMAQCLKLPQEKVMAVFRGLALPDLNNNIRLLATSPPELLRSVKEICTTLCEANLLKEQANVDGLLHPEYLPEPEAT
ncbi:MAG: ABC transporter substrate-binding protein [Georgfuchsia sp.]